MGNYWTNVAEIHKLCVVWDDHGLISFVAIKTFAMITNVPALWPLAMDFDITLVKNIYLILFGI